MEESDPAENASMSINDSDVAKCTVEFDLSAGKEISTICIANGQAMSPLSSQKLFRSRAPLVPNPDNQL